MTEYITTQEAAQLSGLGAGYASRLARRGRIKASKRGGIWWLDRDDFRRHVEEMRALGPQRFNSRPSGGKAWCQLSLGAG